jgi:methylphosphotriester-DNA--protein-cysteine methyltransferase
MPDDVSPTSVVPVNVPIDSTAYRADVKRMTAAFRTLARLAKSGLASVHLPYESEASFNRAFRREYGLPPGRYRRAAVT